MNVHTTMIVRPDTWGLQISRAITGNPRDDLTASVMDVIDSWCQPSQADTFTRYPQVHRDPVADTVYIQLLADPVDHTTRFITNVHLDWTEGCYLRGILLTAGPSPDDPQVPR